MALVDAARTTILAGWFSSACSSSVPTDSADDAQLRVAGGQFVRAPVPAATSGAPAVAAIDLVNTLVQSGRVDYPISGALGPGAVTAAVGLAGDVGYWIVAAGLPDVALPADPSFMTTATFSTALAPGAHTLWVAAIDGSGRFGVPATEIVSVEPASGAPQGALVFTLSWDTESDLDLHVVDPGGVEIDHVTMSDAPPPFSSLLQDAGSYGFLNWDSNAGCVIDGKREEDVVWPAPPPAGTYTVRVDAASLCGQAVAHWAVTGTLEGRLIGRAQGIAVDASTRSPHGAGAGITAMTVHLP